MIAAQIAVVIAVGLAVMAAAVVVMIRVNRSERQIMDRRRAEWVAGGSVPELEPNFYSGQHGPSSDGAGSGSI